MSELGRRNFLRTSHDIMDKQDGIEAKGLVRCCEH